MSLPLHRTASTQALLGGTVPGPLTVEQEVEAFLEPLEDFQPSQKESRRGVAQLLLIMACFLVPHLLLDLSVDEKLSGLLRPVLSLLSGLLIVIIGIASGSVAFTALRRAKPIAFAEAVGAALLMLGIAKLLVLGMGGEGMSTEDPYSELIDLLGPALSLFTIALCPALFEELAFRGLIHNRAQRVLGKHQGVLITATAFMLAHGVSYASPIHLLIGLHLSWLRNRSGSLLPGMVEHFMYNALVITVLY